MNGAQQSRGMVLVSVLWLLVLLMMLAATMARAIATEQQLVANLVGSAKARAAAEAGAYLGMLARIQHDAESWPADGRAKNFRIGDVDVSVRCYDAAGRIDLNTASAELLQGLLDAADVPSDQGEALVDAILDWRDPDSLQRLHGAEDDDYRAMGRDYGARDGAFTRVDELQLVAGMQRKLFMQLRPALTVYARHAGINPRFASPLALRAVPGVSDKAVDMFVHERTAADSVANIPAAPDGMPRRYLAAGGGRYFTIVADAASEQVSSHLELVTVLRPDGNKPFTVLDWREGIEE